MVNDRCALRQQLRRRRREIPRHLAERAAHRLAERLWRQYIEPLPTPIVAGYLACDGEIDLTPLLTQLWQQSITPYVPIIRHQALVFAPYTDRSSMVANRFGILEPDVDPALWLAPHALHLVLVPLVGFDSAGRRLGMGGGFYDRSFAFVRDMAAPPTLIGVGYECQRVDSLPIESWDIPMSRVVTDAGEYPAILNDGNSDGLLVT